MFDLDLFIYQLSKANFAGDEHLKYFGIEVSTEMTRVNGRVLDAPKIAYGEQVHAYSLAFHSSFPPRRPLPTG